MVHLKHQASHCPRFAALSARRGTEMVKAQRVQIRDQILDQVPASEFGALCEAALLAPPRPCGPRQFQSSVPRQLPGRVLHFWSFSVELQQKTREQMLVLPLNVKITCPLRRNVGACHVPAPDVV
ncbi:unnamed protein product [Symbiodinium natans]|uniref:Uncharacterized protein n=1 Tax=Symbiodinium natans TaxID=878477 RepID=A0A812N3M2_9DINO|nr:unnamed protein product [Symbiodinium natans]